jgi:hypothetical protein
MNFSAICFVCSCCHMFLHGYINDVTDVLFNYLSVHLQHYFFLLPLEYMNYFLF